MSKIEGLPVKGYKPQSEAAVAEVNVNKQVEERLLRRIEALAAEGSCDPVWLANARTCFEVGFMALNRAILQPGRVQLPEDDDGG
jgi:hypothetical protein